MDTENKTIDENRQGETLIRANSEKEGTKKLYLESYGCAMNFADSEIVASILTSNGFDTTKNVSEADVVLLNTCSIRDNAEQKVRTRIRQFNKAKDAKPELVIGVLGCMAERLKKQLLEEEKLVDLVAGPDAYKDLPNLLEEVEGGQKAVNVLLSREETYADINPVRLDSNGVTAFISIMRGCDNMCSFCVVPFTRGRERSRDPKSILHEAKYLVEQGYKEVTLLGQNVDSYKWNFDRKGNVLDPEKETVSFAKLMESVAEVNPNLRVRFSTSHPKDMGDDVLEAMARHDNICDYVHLPVQSGSTKVLEKMNRGYSREWYLDRIAAIRRIIPNAAISTDVISGFCTETRAQHEETISLMDEVKFEFAYMYKYSERPKTLAERKYSDDVSEEEKQRRLAEVVAKQYEHSLERNRAAIGMTYEVLVEKVSKKSEADLCGRNSQNTMVVFPKENARTGDYVNVLIEDCTKATLLGKIV